MLSRAAELSLAFTWPSLSTLTLTFTHTPFKNTIVTTADYFFSDGLFV